MDEVEEGEEEESEEEVPEPSPKPYTFKVFRPNNGKCIADGLLRRGNWKEVILIAN